MIIVAYKMRTRRRWATSGEDWVGMVGMFSDWEDFKEFCVREAYYNREVKDAQLINN